MFAQIRDQKIMLLPESVRDYVLKGGDTHITFTTGNNGPPAELILREGGTDAYLSRVK